MVSSPIQTISLQIFYTFERGDQPNLETFRKFMDYVLSCRPTMTPVPRQSLKINYTVSMGDFEIFNFTEHQKHFLCIFKFVQFVQLTSIFLLKLKKWKYGSDECWKGTISSDQSCGFYVEVLGTHKLFQINSNFCPLILPCVLPSSIFALYFALIFCPCPCPLQKRGQGQGQKMRAKYRVNVEEGKKEGKTRYY